MDSIVVNLVLTFVVGRIAAADAEIDWAAEKAQLDAALQKLIPKKWLEEPAQAVADALLTRAQAVMGDQEDEKKLAQDLLAKDWGAAMTDLKTLILSGWSPTAPAEVAVVKLLKSA